MKSWLAISLLISALKLLGQSSISGRLVDQTNDSPMSFATVALYNQSDSSLVTGSISDQNGKFSIGGINSGVYYLEAQFLGYESEFVSSIELSRNQTINLPDIKLAPTGKLLAEVQVNAERLTVLNKVDRQVFDNESFQVSKGGTASDVLRNLPSISINANGEISARGTTGFVVMINGKPLQTDPATWLSQIPANAIKNIEVITAPSAKYDSEGKGGIINIVTTKEATDGTYVMANSRIGLPSIQPYDNAQSPQRFGADFTINQKKDKWDISIGASYIRNDLSGRREGDVYTIIDDTLTRFPSDGERSFVEVNYSGRFTIGFTPNSSNNFSLGFYAGERSKDRTADILYFNNQKIVDGSEVSSLKYYNENLRIRKSDFALGSFDYTHTFGDDSRLYSSLLYEYTLLGGPTTNRNLGWPDTNQILQDEYNTNDNPLYGLRYQLDYRSAPFDFGTIEMGYQYRHLDHRGDFVYERRNNLTGEFELVPDFSSEVNLLRTIHSGYIQLSEDRGRWAYGLGMRMEFMDRELYLSDKTGTLDTTYHYDFLKPFPSGHLQYSPREDVKFKAAYSRRIERTTTFKMNPFPEREHSETLEQGDPALLPEFIDLFELGMIKYFGDNSAFVTAYWRNIANVVNRVNTIYNDSILNRIYSNVGKANSFGIEMGLDLKISDNWKAFMGGNVFNYAISGTFDDRPIENDSWIFSMNANTSYVWNKGWSAQALFNYISAKNTAQGKDSRFYNPSLSAKKSFLDNRLTAQVQWLNIDMGLLNSNEQRITTSRPGEFYTTTNYVYEVDIVMLNLSYSINASKNKPKFIKSEFGEKEF